MFGHSTFYHASIKKTIALVGTLFNDVRIERESSDGVAAQLVRVPLYHGPREKYLARLEGDPNLDQKQVVRLPAISFELVGLRYDADRKLSSLGRVHTRAASPSGVDYSASFRNPVPYEAQFSVSVLANSEEDAAKVLEPILPFFTPAWHVTVKMLDDAPEVKTDVYVNMGAIQYQDVYEGRFEKRRAVVWQFDLTVKTYFYGPVSEAKVIKIASVPLYASTDATRRVETITVRPGLTANGEPTTVLADSVPVSQIEEFDPWDYVITVEENEE